MSQEFASAGLTAGQLNAIVKMLGGEEGALRFLRGELVVSKLARRWREEDGVIYFTVTSDGTTGPDWITRLEKQGFRIGSYAKSVLLSSAFEPTNGVATKIAVLKGEFFEAGDRFTENIRAAATRSGFVPPSAEAACLIREMFTDKDIEAMGLWWIVIMHEPINDSDGDPNLLGANRNGDGRWLNANFDEPGNRWNRDNGFAFAVSQLSSFLTRFCGRVLFCELTVPAAKHLAGLVQLHGKRDIFFIIKRSCFPENHKKHAESVHFFDCQSDIRMFFIARKKTGGRYRFYYFDK